MGTFNGEKVKTAKTRKHRRRIKPKYILPLILICLLFVACIGAIVYLVTDLIRDKKNSLDMSEIDAPVEGSATDYSYLLDFKEDPWQKQITFYYPGEIGGKFGLYQKYDDGTTNLICSMQYDNGNKNALVSDIPESGTRGTVQYVLNFGENGDFPIPAAGETLTFVMTADNISDPSLKGRTISKIVEVTKDSFSNLVIKAELEDLGDNRYKFTWNETAGNAYIVQLKQKNGEWGTFAELGADNLSFETGHLKSYTDYTFRIAVMQLGEIKNVTDEFDIHTGISITYATVWPTKNLDLYSDANRSRVIGTAYLGKSYCVMDVQGKMFHVYTPEGGGYIDSDCCMVNLPDYLGGMCNYDITNSYFSNYMCHEYEIKGVSGMITEGYEHVLLSDGTFLVPLLYPVTDKLITASNEVLADGMRLKIYDSFRPYIATRSIYDITELQLDRVLPAETMQRVKLPEYLVLKDTGLMTARYTDTELIKSTIIKENEELAAIKAQLEYQQQLALMGLTSDMMNPDGAVDPETGVGESFQTYDEYMYLIDPEAITYRTAMLDGRHPLNNFLAQNGSRHNLGVAMDLTLEELNTGEEIYAQTRIHDLTFNSELYRNNESANLLAKYMKDAGFHDLTSEWWHFQDDEVKDRLNPVSVRDGVSVEGWKVDDNGVRYRLADGTYSTGYLDIDGTTYFFDEAGYLSAP